MSKSAGNFYRLSDVVEKIDDLDEDQIYRAIRMMRLQNVYRDSFNFTFDKIHAAHNTLGNIDSTIKRLGLHESEESSKIDRSFRDFLQDSMLAFVAYLEDDFDTVNALTVLFELLGYINKTIDERQLSSAEKNALKDFLQSFDEVLGVIDLCLFDGSCDIPDDVQTLLDQRTVAKAEKDYGLADKIRDQIIDMGYEIVDAKEGTQVVKK